MLRRARLVVTRKEGSTVYYPLTSPHIAELLAVARTVLSTVLSGQVELLADLRGSGMARPARQARQRRRRAAPES